MPIVEVVDKNGRTVKRKASRGIYQDGEYIGIRIFPNGATKPFLKQIGRATFDNLDAAESKLSEYRRQLKLGKLNLEEPQKRVSFEVAWKTWYDLHGSKIASWFAVRSRGKHLKAVLGKKWVDEITYLDILDLRQKLSASGLHPTTVNKCHSDVRQIYYRLDDWRKIKKIASIKLPISNPAKVVRGILEKTDERQFIRKRVLEDKEIDILMSVCNERTRRIVLGALNTLLSRKDLRLLDLNVHLDKANNKFTGNRTKSKSGYDISINAVCRWLIETTPANGIVFDFKDFTNEWPEVQKRAMAKGVAHFMFKDLRRTGATLLHKEGVPIETLRKMLGHTDQAMTQRYLNLSDDVGRAEVESYGNKYLKHLTSDSGSGRITDGITAGMTITNGLAVEAKAIVEKAFSKVDSN